MYKAVEVIWFSGVRNEIPIDASWYPPERSQPTNKINFCYVSDKKCVHTESVLLPIYRCISSGYPIGNYHQVTVRSLGFQLSIVSLLPLIFLGLSAELLLYSITSIISNSIDVVDSKNIFWEFLPQLHNGLLHRSSGVIVESWFKILLIHIVFVLSTCKRPKEFNIDDLDTLVLQDWAVNRIIIHFYRTKLSNLNNAASSIPQTPFCELSYFILSYCRI